MVTWLDNDLLTERLVLRQHRADDQQALVDMATDAEVRRYIGGPKSYDEALAFAVANGVDVCWGHFLLTSRENDQVIGTLSFDQKRGPWEVSFQLARSAWGRGLMGEALEAARDWFFHESEDPEFIAVTQKANRRTRSLLSRVGGICVAEFEQYGLPQVQYAFTRGTPAQTATATCFSCHMNANLAGLPRAEQIATFGSWRLAHARSTSLPGWVILVAARHLTSLEELSPDEASSLGLAQRAVSAAHRSVLGATKTYSVLFTEVVEHLHVHLIPRMPWFAESEKGPRVMELLSAPEGQQLGAQELDDIARKLQQALRS